MKTRMAVLVLLGWIVAACLAVADDPVGWRNDGSGRFPSAKPPSEWSSSKNVLWKASLPGQSYSSPVVVGDNLYVASDPADLLCIRRSDGKVLWKKSLSDVKAPAASAPKGGPGGKGGPKGGGGFGGGGRSAGNSAATPVSDGKHVGVLLGNGVAAVYDLEGKRLWGRHVESSSVGFGHASSPLLLDGKLIVHVKDLVALDVATGKESWRASLQASHASPVAAKLGKQDVIVSPAGAVVRASDGKVLAKGGFRSSDNSPVVEGNKVYVLGRGAFELSQNKDEVKVTSLWTAEGGGGGGKGPERRLSSPVLHDGLLYGLKSDGILEVLDAKSGESVYRQRLPVGQAYSSITLAGNLLYVFDLSGKAVVFEPGRKYVRVATNELEGTGCCPVAAGDHLYVRGRQTLYCVSGKAAKSDKKE